MTEYATDPEAIQEFLTARDRTANWVTVHSQGLNYISPSSPPSIISDSDAPSYGPSDSDSASTHSVPPRMILRYPDGTNLPIPSSSGSSPTHSRSKSNNTYGPQSSSRHTRSRSGSRAAPAPADVPPVPPARYAQTLSYATGSRYAASTRPHIEPPRSPESIRVLPSRQAEDAQPPPGRVPASSASHHSRGVPAAQGIFQPQSRQPSIHPSQHHDRVPPPLADPLHTSNRSVIAPTPRHPSTTAQTHPYPAAPVGIAQSQSQPASVSQSSGSRFYEHAGIASRAPSQLPYQYSPPAIVYAPSSRHKGSNYNPPAIVYSPSSQGHHRRPGAPGGITYSRSDPLPHPSQYSPLQTNAGNTPFPSVQGSTSHHSQRHRSAPPQEDRVRSRAASAARGRPPAREYDFAQPPRSRTRSPTPSLSASDTASDTSGSTYYVLPSPGQKVQIIVPNSSSVYTASGKSPRSPGSGSSSGSSPKKPFFQRLFSRGSGSVDSRGSSGQGKRLQRRHTVGGTHLRSSSRSGR
ncbi:hypothetical protein GY45DRAFT_1248212 [Cubamyces sp. BRFM 1775]|nr:hypothetical protein GY45DRAFT_1248212 [Cubamyces sp. BRFM 1775]